MGEIGEYDVTNMPFIPNSMIDFWTEAFASDSEKLKVYQSYSHESRLKHMSKIESDQCKYPIIEKLNGEQLSLTSIHLKYMNISLRKLCLGIRENQWQDLMMVVVAGRHIYYVLNTSKQMIDFLNGDKFDKIKESVLFSQRQISDKPK